MYGIGCIVTKLVVLLEQPKESVTALKSRIKIHSPEFIYAYQISDMELSYFDGNPSP